MSNKTINLQIDKIVLDGIGRLNRGQLALSLEKEMHRLISSHGLHRSLNQSMSITHVSAKPLLTGNHIREKQLGRQIAHSVYRGLKR